MRRSWGLTQKILNGQKKIESRWYSVRYTPWNKIKRGDIVYFKNSGEPVKIKTEVSKVIQFDDLNSRGIRKILKEYGNDIGLDKNISKFFNIVKNKKYCILIFLKNPKNIKPFDINKSGYGAMSAWITVRHIKEIKTP